MVSELSYRGVWRAVQESLLPDVVVSIPRKQAILSTAISLLIAQACFKHSVLRRETKIILSSIRASVEYMNQAIRTACRILNSDVCEELSKTASEHGGRTVCEYLDELMEKGSSLPPTLRVQWYSIIAISLLALLSRPEDYEMIEREITRLEMEETLQK